MGRKQWVREVAQVPFRFLSGEGDGEGVTVRVRTNRGDGHHLRYFPAALVFLLQRDVSRIEEVTWGRRFQRRPLGVFDLVRIEPRVFLRALVAVKVGVVV